VNTIDDKRSVDSKTTPEDDAGTRDFIETHDVTKVKRKPTPGAGEEAADLSQVPGKADAE
jgi:hypothetical protein